MPYYADGESITEWEVMWLDIESGTWFCSLTFADRAEAVRRLGDLSEVWGHHARLRTRTVTTSPWVEEQS